MLGYTLFTPLDRCQRQPCIGARYARSARMRPIGILLLTMLGVVRSLLVMLILITASFTILHSAAGAQVAAQVAAQIVSDTSASVPASSDTWTVRALGTQINVIGQDLRPFHSPYAGVNSLSARGDSKISHAYGAYVGAQAGRYLQGYLDVEMIRGKGISGVTGLAGPTNGDVLRQGTFDLGNGPYVARAFVRYTVPLAGKEVDTLQRGIDQLPGPISSRRVEITAGKLAASDLFDVNRYANTTRQQFINWDLFNNTAWDFAADTRGYSNGIAVAWIHPLWTLRVGSFQMPTVANGNKFDSDLRRARGDHVELTLVAPQTGTIARFLGYMNHGRMGSYADALAKGRATNTVPDIAADGRPGRSKYGYGVNLEQPLADGGETGMFARLGWSDGKNESFVFTEVDRHVSAGLQLSGVHWGRKDDSVGIAGAQTGIVQIHRDYLNAGGLGFLLGDGKLNYGPEQLVEMYYRAQIGTYFQVGPDVQYIRNPGYNHDRGPATVLSLRVNLRY
ncbi:MAG: carbohydrate porin [Gemmatimonadaceae bacterium]